MKLLKDVYDQLVKKVNAINTSGLVKKTNYDTKKINKIKGKIASTVGLAIQVFSGEACNRTCTRPYTCRSV